jgi:hypothetical protein
MRRIFAIRWIFVVLVVLVHPGTVSYATTIAFYSDGVIQKGETYDKVDVYDTPPAHTTVDMTGGQVNRPGMFTYDATTVNISGGYVNSLRTYGSSIVNILGGSVCDSGSYVISHDSSTVNLYEGGTLHGLSFGEFHLQDSSVFNIYGGDALLFVMPFDFGVVNVHNGYVYAGIQPHEYSTINVYGGCIETFWENIGVPDTATVNIYGYGLEYNPQGRWKYHQDPTEGWWISKLTGYGFDGTPITYWGLPDPALNPNIEFIPEPSTVLLCALGGLWLAMKRKTTRIVGREGG